MYDVSSDFSNSVYKCSKGLGLGGFLVCFFFSPQDLLFSCGFEPAQLRSVSLLSKMD